MNYEIYEGKYGKKYYVMDKVTRMKQLAEIYSIIAREAKTSAGDYTSAPCWIKDDEMYLEPVKGAKKKLAVFRK